MPTVQATIISGFPVLRLGQDAQPSAPRAGSNHTSFRAIGRASLSTSPGGSGSFSARPFSHSFCRSGTSEEASSPQPVKSPDSGIRLGRIGQDCACPRSHGTIKAGKGRMRPFGRGVCKETCLEGVALGLRLPGPREYRYRAQLLLRLPARANTGGSAFSRGE